MAYTPQSEQQVLANMLGTYASLVPTVDDLNPGSVVRSIFETVAREIKNQTVNQTEDAAELQQTGPYSIFNFPLLTAQSAYTMEQFNVATAPTSDVPVPAGTTVSIPGTTVQYQTAADFTWPSGQTSVSIRIVCTQTGVLGNTPANTITQLNGGITGLSNVTVTNIRDVISGADQETQYQRAQRFTNSLDNIHRGDDGALKYGPTTAKLIDDYGYVSEKVIKVQVVEGAGTNTIYIDNGTYNTSNALLDQCQMVVDGYIDTGGNKIIGYKASGIPSTVVIATLQQVSISVAVTPEPGYSLDMIQQTITDSLTQLVQSLNVGDTLYLSDLNLAVGNVVGVLNYVISAPTADVVPAAGTLLQMASNNPDITLK